MESCPFAAAERSPSSSNHVQENVSKLALETFPLSTNKVESSNDLNVAKIAAVRAAELGTVHDKL